MRKSCRLEQTGLFASSGKGKQTVQLVTLPAIVATSPLWVPVVAPVVCAAVAGVAISIPLTIVGFAGKLAGLWR